MSILVSDVSYHYHNQSPLFEQLSLSTPTGSKASIIGDNGSGKSTLLRLISGELSPSKGSVSCAERPFYLPQRVGITSGTVAEALGVEATIKALHAIDNGSTEAADYDALHDDWGIESRCRAAFERWGLHHIALSAHINTLSGGEKTKLFLAALTIHGPRIVLLDEPTNHLDTQSRQMLYDYIAHTHATLIVVSHDIALLNSLPSTYELSRKGLRLFGGNYQFYTQQKAIEEEALEQHISAELTNLRLAHKKAQQVKERQEKRSNKGNRDKEQSPRILRRGLKDQGERTAAKLSEKRQEKQLQNQQRIEELRKMQLQRCDLKLDVADVQLHVGKTLTTATDLNFGYEPDAPLWQSPITFTLRSGDRVHLTGNNGTGKSTFIRLITGELMPSTGKIVRSDFSYIYLDQEYSRAHTSLTVLQLAESHNHSLLPDHELKIRLHRALFPQSVWDKPCHSLSGGERMRLCLCCMMISNHIPDLIILDEPGNNLDIAGLRLLTHTIDNYKGTLIVVSHDRDFAEKVHLISTLHLEG